MRILEKATRNTIPDNKFVFTCDALDKSVPKPLPQRLNFFMLIIGSPGSGKTTLLMNLICRRASPYRKRFDTVYVFSPSLGTLKSNPFKCLPEEQKHDDISIENITEVLETISESGEKVLLILDDVVNSLRSSKELETLMSKIAHNRRHLCGGGGSLSIIMTSQVFRNKVPVPIRKSVSHLITFQVSKLDFEAMFQEYGLVSRVVWEGVIKYIFKVPRSFLYLDLNAPPEEMFHRNWNKLTIEGI